MKKRRATSPGRKRKLPWFQIASFVLFVGLLALVASVPAVRHAFQRFLDWATELGPLGLALVAAAHVPAAVVLVPIPLLNVGGGIVGGLVPGAIAAWSGTVAGAVVSFLIARRFARGRIRRWIGGDERLRALDGAIGENGFKLVFLLRLSPLFPYGALNYTLGMTRISFRRYLLATALGLLPKTIMYVSLGAAVRSVSDLAAGDVELSLAQQILLGIGVAATAVAAIAVTRIAGRTLRRTPAFE